MAMTRVLVVDDSALMRRLLGGVLGEAGFVVETARNGAEGVAKVTEWEPDVVTLDINMPEMDGLTALSLLMEARPTPVVMVSSLTEKGAMSTFEALALGAVDYVAKPGGTISLSIQSVADELIRKIRTAAGSQLKARGGVAAPARAAPAERKEVPRAQPRLQSRLPAKAPASGLTSVDGVVLVGVSTGGPRTLEDILPLLPAGFAWPVVVAQHMPPNFTDAFARRMDRLCEVNVREVSATMPLERGAVYIGKGGTDVVLVERLGRIAVQPRPEAPEHPWHPSVDVMVQSAMRLLRPQQIIGVQLTGMGDDGAEAMAALKRAGGRTIAEAEATAVVFGMPRELIERNGATVVLPCDDVARQLCHWVR
jgi:two-component system chemotaxis response regulator CheB